MPRAHRYFLPNRHEGSGRTGRMAWEIRSFFEKELGFGP